MQIYFLRCMCFILITGCGTYPHLQPSQDPIISTSLGGPTIQLGNDGIWVPNLGFELNHPVSEKVDLNLGWHGMASLFGVLGVHGGASYQILTPNTWLPGLNSSGRMYFFSNQMVNDRIDKGNWLLVQPELTAYYPILTYGTVFFEISTYYDYKKPHNMLSPSIGYMSPFWKKFQIGFEFTHLASQLDNRYTAIKWKGIHKRGTLMSLIHLGYQL